MPRLPERWLDPRRQIAVGLDRAVSVAVMVYALLLFIPRAGAETKALLKTVEK